MILNVSRAKMFHLCERKAFNWSHRRAEFGRSMNLVDGGAFHHGVAVGRASKDWARAAREAEELFQEDVKKSTIPEEQLYLIEEHKELVLAMLKCFAEQYEHENYQILQPECQFDVALPGSEHNCIFLHHDEMTREHPDTSGFEKWQPPTPEAILEHRVKSPHLKPDPTCPCWQPHRIVGKTDALVLWNQNLWLDEYKTTSIDGQQFWDQWAMDMQISVYLYGTWKALGIRPRGTLMNAIFKPSEAQVANWNNKRKHGPSKGAKDYIRYSREAFLRTEEDLERAAQWMLQTAMDWEEQVCSGSERMQKRVPFFVEPSSHSCLSYNRKCEYWSACLSHEAEGEFDSMSTRPNDYVDDKYLVQIEGVK